MLYSCCTEYYTPPRQQNRRYFAHNCPCSRNKLPQIAYLLFIFSILARNITNDLSRIVLLFGVYQFESTKRNKFTALAISWVLPSPRIQYYTRCIQKGSYMKWQKMWLFLLSTMNWNKLRLPHNERFSRHLQYQSQLIDCNHCIQCNSALLDGFSVVWIH